MNKYKIASLLLFFSFVSSCVEEDLPSEINSLTLVHQGLGVSTKTISFGYDTSLTRTITITAENTDWEITGCPDWLTLSKTNGHGTTDVLLTARENKSAEVSYASTLTVQSLSKGYPYFRTIAISQQAAAPFITPAKTSAAYSFAAQTDIISISSNVDWYAESSASWLTATEVSNEKLSISMTENQGGEERKATISLKRKQNNQVYAKILVNQEGISLKAEPTSLSFESVKSSQSFTVEANAPWTISSSPSWLSLSVSEGSKGKTTITASVEENPNAVERSGQISIKCFDVVLTINVRQDESIIIPNEDENELPNKK